MIKDFADHERLQQQALFPCMDARELIAQHVVTSSEEPNQVGVGAALLDPRQLNLFDSHTARYAKVEEALQGGRFEEAAALARAVRRRFDREDIDGLAAALEQLAEHLRELESAADLEKLAALAANRDAGLLSLPLPAALRSALSRGMHRRTAEAAERRGLLVVLGRPVGHHWLRAEATERARVSLEAAVLRKMAVGESLSSLGNLAFSENSIAMAREAYRRAFCEDPNGIPVESITDAEVRDLLDDAEELGLDPPALWVPMVGYAAGLFQLPVEPQGQGACREFHAALLAGRRTRDTAHRRRMKELAQLLFERLRDTNKL